MFCGKWDFEDVIKVTDQLTLKCYPGGPTYPTSPEKQRCFLADSRGVIRDSKHEMYLTCYCWLEAEFCQ